MAKILGHTTNSIVPQSDFSASKNENGGWTASQSFQILKGSLDNLAVKGKFPGGATLRSLDPDCDDLFAFLRLSKVLSIRTVDGGWTRITVEFVGFSDGTSTSDPPLSTPIPTYTKRGALSEAPLDEHPKWKDLTNLEKWYLGQMITGELMMNQALTLVGHYQEDTFGRTFVQATDNSDDPITRTGDALDFAKRIAQGKTTYKFGTYEYTHRWEDNVGISAAQMNKLGKIATPSGNPPKPGTGRDWMMTGVNEEQYGSGDFRFTNEITYLLSDEGGHDDFLYD